MKFGFIFLFASLALFQITEVDSVKCGLSLTCTQNKIRTTSSNTLSTSASVLWRGSVYPATFYKSSHTKISNSLSTLRTIYHNVNDRLIGSYLKGETFPVFYRIIIDAFNTGATDLTNACTRFQAFTTNFSSSLSDVSAYSPEHSSILSAHNANLTSLITDYCSVLQSTIGTTVSDAVSIQLASLISQVQSVLTEIRKLFAIETQNIFLLSITAETIIKAATGSYTNSSLSISGSISSTRTLTNIYTNIWLGYSRVLLLRQSALYTTIGLWASSATWTPAWTGTLKSRFEAAYNSVITELNNINGSVFDCNYNYASDIYAEYNTVLSAMIVDILNYYDYVVDTVYSVWGTSATCALRAQSSFTTFIYYNIPKMKSCASTFNYKLSQTVFDLHKVVFNVYVQTYLQINKLFICPIRDRTDSAGAVSCMESGITALETIVSTQLGLLNTAKTAYCSVFTDTSSLFSKCTTAEFDNGHSQLIKANSTFSACL